MATTIAVLKSILASFLLLARRGENAFKVINNRGQLGHLQSSVDPPLGIAMTVQYIPPKGIEKRQN